MLLACGISSRIKQAQHINCTAHIKHSNEVDISRSPVLVWQRCEIAFNCIFRFSIKLNVVAPAVIMIALQLQPIEFLKRGTKKCGLDLWLEHLSVGREQ